MKDEAFFNVIKWLGSLLIAAGIFNIFAAVFDLKRYVDFWSFRRGRPKPRLKNRNVLRFFIGFAGGAMIFFGIAAVVC